MTVGDNQRTDLLYSPMMVSRSAFVASVALLAAACGSSSTTADDPTLPVAPSAVDVGEQRFPDVIGVVATLADDGWAFDVTVSSPYDTAERYADAWRVVGPDGAVLGVRELLHDHAGEQPFTRSLRGVEISSELDVVVVEGRDSSNGWGGQALEISLDRG